MIAFDIILLLLLVVMAIAAIATDDLLNSVIILSAYSLIMALVWVEMNSIDVGFTEASVGAGISTVLFIAALARTSRLGKEHNKSWLPLLIVLATALILFYSTIDMSNFGDSNAPINKHVVPRYVEKSKEEAGVVNIVTAIIIGYRGYDTLGETSVIFTAGTAVVLLLRSLKNAGR